MARRVQFDLVGDGVVRISEPHVSSVKPFADWSDGTERPGCWVVAGAAGFHVKGAYDDVLRRLGWKRGR
jgi:hypothetical protein